MHKNMAVAKPLFVIASLNPYAVCPLEAVSAPLYNNPAMAYENAIHGGY